MKTYKKLAEHMVLKDALAFLARNPKYRFLTDDELSTLFSITAGNDKFTTYRDCNTDKSERTSSFDGGLGASVSVSKLIKLPVLVSLTEEYRAHTEALNALEVGDVVTIELLHNIRKFHVVGTL